jgi:hypothetical protein
METWNKNEGQNLCSNELLYLLLLFPNIHYSLQENVCIPCTLGPGEKPDDFKLALIQKPSGIFVGQLLISEQIFIMSYKPTYTSILADGIEKVNTV